MFFDDALPKFVSLARDRLGPDAIDKGLILRDAEGRLTFIIRSEVAAGARDAFDVSVIHLLGPYSELPSATPEQLFDDTLLENEGVIRQAVLVGEVRIEINLLDRRIIGQDWNQPNFVPVSNDVPVVTFFSCKGGVGRSTALIIAASALSQAGKNVLIVDFDIEAPGLGSLMLNDQDYPEFGLIDLLVEERIQAIDHQFIERCIAPSPLTAGRGLIEVMPAVGVRGRDSPANFLPKLGRAFLEGYEDGRAVSYLSQARSVISRLAARGRSSIILIDARAGLSEASAPTVLGLGGSVLLFGVDTPQTFECYRYLFSHLANFVEDGEFDWRYKLRMIHAKAGRGEDSWRKFREKSYEVFAETLYEEAEGDDLEAFNFDIDDPSAPHYAWPIPFDLEYVEIDPRTSSSFLGKDFFERSFGPFLDRFSELAFGGVSGD